MSLKDLEWFLGFVNYYCFFIKEFVYWVGLLYEIIGKRVFNDLIVVLIIVFVLVIFNVNDFFIFDIDVFVYVIGVELI